MNHYIINYQTGITVLVIGTIEEAITQAEQGLSYTQENVSIEFIDGKQVAYLPWWNVIPGEDDFVTARFGEQGFYGEWVIL